MKRIISILAALCLLFCLSTTVLATGTTGTEAAATTTEVEEGESETSEDVEEDSAIEGETAVERITSMQPAEWVVAAVLLGMCGFGYYMTQRKE